MLKVPPFKQTDDSRCGPAVIKSILAYYDIEASEDEICELCNHSYELGCDDKGMVNALRHYGLSAVIYNESTLEDIEYWIKRKIPVIVDWFTGGIAPTPADTPNGHSSIVVDIDQEKIHLLDPENGEIRSIARDSFNRVWFDWRSTPTIQTWSNMILRQLIVPYKINI